jgi:molecular chaperone DnaJ
VPDFYHILGVSKTSTPDEIKSAYRKLAKLSHPDRNPGDKDAEVRYHEVTEAYEALSDPVKRSQYDLQGFVGRSPPRPKTKPAPPPPPRRPKFDAADIFKHTKHVYGGTVERGASIQIQMEIELQEAAAGCTKRIKVNRRGVCQRCQGAGGSIFSYCQGCGGMGTQVHQAVFGNVVNHCPLCGGKGRKPTDACSDCLGFGFTPAKEHEIEVTIPAGITNGMQVRIPGCGEAGKGGVPPGDLMVVALVKEHPLYKLKNLDIHIDAWFSYTQLVLGSEFVVPCLLKGSVVIKIPPGTNSGTKFRVKGMGFRDVDGDVGDMIIIVRSESPSAISDEYKAALEVLKELEAKHITTERESFVKKLAAETR